MNKEHKTICEIEFKLSLDAAYLYNFSPSKYLDYYTIDNYNIYFERYAFDQDLYTVYECCPMKNFLCKLHIINHIFKDGKVISSLIREVDDKLDVGIAKDEFEKTRFEYMVNEGFDIDKFDFLGHVDFLNKFAYALATKLEESARKMSLKNE